MPGSFELPVVAKSMAKSGAYDAIVCIGAVVRQSPSHHTLRMLDQADSAQNQHCSPLQPGHGSASVCLTVLTFSWPWCDAVQIMGATTHYDAVVGGAVSGVLGASTESGKNGPLGGA